MYLTGKLGRLFIKVMSEHICHDVELVDYGTDSEGNPQNISIECITCCEVLIDANVEPKPKRRKK